jgi:transposase
MTALCVVNETGRVTAEGKVASEPEALGRWLREHAPAAGRIGMETGPLAVWLWNGPKERGLPVHVIDARHAKAGLALQASKTDRNDARGLAQIMRTGWFKEVRVKSTAAHLLRALLASRGMLVATRCALEKQVRGLLETFGPALGKAGRVRFEIRLRELLAAEPRLGRLVAPLLEVRRSLVEQIRTYDRCLVAIARRHAVMRRLMDVPGVGAVTAVAFVSAINDSSRFRCSRHVGAYFGLAPQRYQSGEVDRSGRISKAGDQLAHPAVRGCQRAPHQESAAVRAEDLGRSHCRSLRAQEGQSRPGQKARRGTPSALARRHGLRSGLAQLALVLHSGAISVGTMARASSIYGVDEPCYAVNNMESLEPSDALMMPAATPSSKRTLIPATPATKSLPPTARLVREPPQRAHLSGVVVQRKLPALV